MLRGGALKPTSTGRWAHLVCAVSIPEVLLEDTISKEPILATDIPRSRKKLVLSHVPCEIMSVEYIYALNAEMLNVPDYSSQYEPGTGSVCAVCERPVLFSLPCHLCPVQRSSH